MNPHRTRDYMRRKRGSAIDRVCKRCGAPFVLGAHHHLHKFCSFECRRLANVEFMREYKRRYRHG